MNNFLGAVDGESNIDNGVMGVVANDTTYTADTPYTIIGNLEIQKGVTLTLEAGTQLDFSKNTGINVNGGHLVIQGTAENPVILKSTTINASRGVWKGIEMVAGSATIDHAQISDYVQNKFTNSDVIIKDSSFSNFSSNGLYLKNTSTGLIKNNDIYSGTTNVGTCVRLENASPTLQGNQISHCAQGIYLLGASNGLINGGNQITQNKDGIFSGAIHDASTRKQAGPQAIINRNQISNNTRYNYFLEYYGWRYVPGYASMTLNAQENWWGSSDAVVIQAKIYDRNDRGLLPFIEITDYLLSAEGAISDNEPAEITQISSAEEIRSGKILVQATDLSGIDRVEFTLDGTPLESRTEASGYAATIDYTTLTAGAHELDFTVYDGYQNGITETISLDLQFQLPATPVITFPANGTIVGTTDLTLRGTSDTQTQALINVDDDIATEAVFVGNKGEEATIQIYLNGSALGTPVSVASNGTFQQNISLPTGGGTYTIKTITRAGDSPLSEAVSIVFDEQGPEIVNISYLGNPLLDNIQLTQSDTFTVNIPEASRVEFIIDGVLVHTDTNGNDGYSFDLTLTSLTEGEHTLSISAYDSFDNVTTQTVTFIVAVAPPAAPSLTSPENGLVTNQKQINVTGEAEPQSTVTLSVNGTEQGNSQTVADNGLFESTITLTAGINNITAVVNNRGGNSAASSPISVTQDNSIPQAPVLSLTVNDGEEIILSWNAINAEPSVSGYRIYRANTAFDTISTAQQINSGLLNATTYTDLPPSDGNYYYRVLAENTLGTQSALSNQVLGNIDSTAPQALSIQYIPAGYHDNETGRFGVGEVEVIITVNEPLLLTPFFSLTPNLGVPISVALTKTSDTEYRGQFEIKQSTPSGIAYGVFSARDSAGNRGTSIEEGSSINIDTDGPIVTAITLTPEHPIKNDNANPVNINVMIDLDEAVQSNLQPALSYKLSADGREDVQIDNLTLSEPLKWTASFQLPADAGEIEPETLQFSFEAKDDLDNISTKISAKNAFQIYQGDLPPLDFPLNLTATSLADGKIHLSWDEVDEATDYLIYRQAPDESTLQSLAGSNNTLEYTDQTSVDGIYTYAVATVREINAEQSISSPGQTVDVIADATAPATPQNLQLALVGVGINASWENSATEEGISYSLYRASITDILTVDGLTPVLETITDLTATDPSPSQAEHAYVVTAVDASGNESEPSTTAYLNFGLLPVNSFSVVQQDNQQPTLSWSHASPATIAGYNLNIRNNSNTSGVDVNQLTETDYTDSGYTSDERLYTLIAYDSNNVESIERQLLLPRLKAELHQDTQLKRGVMNRLIYTVSNEGISAVSHIEIQVVTGAHSAHSEQFTLNAGEIKIIEVVLGGYQDLEGLTTLKNIINIQPAENSQVQIIRHQDVIVTDAGLVFDIASRDFLRGGSGEVQISLINTSAVEVEIKTGHNARNLPSDDLRFKLIDQNGNILSTQGFKQYLGDKTVTLANGHTVARIPAGETYTSAWMSLDVPASAPDTIDVTLEVDKLHYHLGKDDAESINVGIQSSQSIGLIETPYYAEIGNITPESSYGDEDIIITGRAINRISQQPEYNVPLKLVIANNGFERIKDIQSDSEGNFSYLFQPLAHESGNYQVSVIHPDISDRPQQAQFSIGAMTLAPNTINLNSTRNLYKSGYLSLNINKGTVANNVRLEFKAEDQESAALPAGIEVTLPDPVNVSEQQSISLPLTIKGDENALDKGRFVLVLRSDETGDTALSTVTVNYSFSVAAPFLGYSPAHLETGVVYDGSVSEQIQLENKGLLALDNITLDLLTQQGTPVPAWVKLQTIATRDKLDVGEKYPVQIQLSPNNTVAEGIHHFILRVSSDNFDTTDIPITVAVSQSGIGHALIKISDIYTATLDAEGEPIQGVTNARIKLINNNVTSIEENLSTDNTGEALFTDMTAGTYRYRVSADNHKDQSGQIEIKPGITIAKDIFLNYELITVEWSVNEIALLDIYEITLHATYLTDVPAAVIVIDPPSTSLPTGLKKGDVFNGEFSVTNHGLIRADGFKVELPADDQFFQYQLMGGIPDTLEAKETITVPYRAVMLQSFEPDGTASGGGCSSYTECGEASATSACANGSTSNTSSPHCITYHSGDCSANAGVSGSGGSITGRGGGWVGGIGGGGSGVGSIDEKSGMSNCRIDCPDGKCPLPGNGGG